MVSDLSNCKVIDTGMRIPLEIHFHVHKISFSAEEVRYPSRMVSIVKVQRDGTKKLRIWTQSSWVFGLAK